MATTDKTTPDVPVKTPYRALSRINHDLEEYEPGETILLSDAPAEPLLSLGVISLLES